MKSPFATPFPNLRIKEFTPVVPRPTKEEIEQFPAEAKQLLDSIEEQQVRFVDQFPADWMEGRHFLIAGGTGPGLGGAIEGAVRKFTERAGSVTVVSRDISRSVGFEMGKQMSERANAAGFGNRYHLLNDGLAIDGPAFEKTLDALKEAGAKDIIYINCVAAAMSGLLPGFPPVYVKDVDDKGLFQWQLMPLPDNAIQNTKYIMGELAVKFPAVLENHGFHVAGTCYIDWRGSLDAISRDPGSEWYGRQGAYSTSLYLPKLYLQEDTRRAYGTKRIVLDAFLPIMRTRALPFIPGGMTLSYLYDHLMQNEHVRRRDVPELALSVLFYIGHAMSAKQFDPFVRHDYHESPLEDYFVEVMTRMNDDESSDFYWKRWMTLPS